MVQLNETERASRHRVEVVYRDQGPRLWRSVYAFSRSVEITDEAVAEAFAQALRRGVDVRDPERWIWRVAFRIAAGELKARRRLGHPSFAEPTYEPPDVVPIVEALSRLSPNQRACLVLFHFAGYPTKEIAQRLGISSQAVRVHLVRARRRFRDLIGEEDDAT